MQEFFEVKKFEDKEKQKQHKNKEKLRMEKIA